MVGFLIYAALGQSQRLEVCSAIADIKKFSDKAEVRVKIPLVKKRPRSKSKMIRVSEAVGGY